MDIQEAKEFINSVRWQYAKTYPNAPHEYTVLSWMPENKAKMVEFAYLIQSSGREEVYYKKKFKVLDINEYKYWTMDYPLEKTDLVNRTYKDDIFKAKVRLFINSYKFNYKSQMTLDDIVGQMNGNSG